jgi:hypothetical protein
MDISVGDFAEQVMAMDSLPKGNSAPTFNPTPSHLPTGLDDQAPDISKIEVPNDFISSLVENQEKAEVEVARVDTPRIVEKVKVDEGLTGLLQEVKGLLEDLKVQLNEMSTVGMMGVGPGKAPKEEDPEDDKLQDLLTKIRKKKTRK